MRRSSFRSRMWPLRGSGRIVTSRDLRPWLIYAAAPRLACRPHASIMTTILRNRQTFSLTTFPDLRSGLDATSSRTPVKSIFTRTHFRRRAPRGHRPRMNTQPHSRSALPCTPLSPLLFPYSPLPPGEGPGVRGAAACHWPQPQPAFSARGETVKPSRHFLPRSATGSILPRCFGLRARKDSRPSTNAARKSSGRRDRAWRSLGHANISTTQRYMNLDDRELADAQDLVE